LSALSGAAETYVNLSRLQLALAGLAAQDAVTRVAGRTSELQHIENIANLNYSAWTERPSGCTAIGATTPRRPTGSRGAMGKGASEGRCQWRESRTVEVSAHWKLYIRAITNVKSRYGDEADTPTPTPLYRVLSIPSRVLRSHNLEILVSTLNINILSTVTVSTESSIESVLVPKLQATAARAMPVPYPVHKTVIFGEGLDSAIEFGRFSSDVTEDLSDMLKVAVDLPPPSAETDLGAQSGNASVNLQVATEALATFRESIQNSIAYERGWYRSGLPSLSSWITPDLQTSEPIKPALKSLVSSVVDDVEANILQEDTIQVHKLGTLSKVPESSASILSHLETWAEKSHTELRDELDDAFSARNWQKLSWWKLFWRVDDVTMISSDVLERKWLVKAEKSSIYLAGRMNQAGFPDEALKLAVSSIPEVTTQDTAPTAENPRMDVSTEVRKPMPWPEHIAAARTELVNDVVPPLQALAQRLILQTFSTTSLSSAASALAYVAVPSFSVFEASAIGVLGLTFSLRHMQKMWEGARESWEGTVREEGRRTLKETEETVRLIVKRKEREDAGLGAVEDEGVRERKEAREALRKVREALGKIGMRGGV
jgi:hypothetical protein